MSTTLHMIEPEWILEMVKALINGGDELFEVIECVELAGGNLHCVVSFTKDDAVNEVVYDWCDYELAGAWNYLDSKRARAYLVEFFYLQLFDISRFIDQWREANPYDLSPGMLARLTVFDILGKEVSEEFLNLWLQIHSLTRAEMLTSAINWHRNLANHCNVAELYSEETKSAF